MEFLEEWLLMKEENLKEKLLRFFRNIGFLVLRFLCIILRQIRL